MRNIKLICYISVLLCLCMPFVLRAEELSVIPYPSVLEQGEGNCSISADTALFWQEARKLSRRLHQARLI